MFVTIWRLLCIVAKSLYTASDRKGTNSHLKHEMLHVLTAGVAAASSSCWVFLSCVVTS